jgi:hypothetical protein
MTGRITRQRDLESLKIAARWPDADKNVLVTLASRLAVDEADAEGYRYFSDLSSAQPDSALPLALAGFFQARLAAGTGAGASAALDIKPGLLRYPASSALAELRLTALHRLMERYQQSDPFKFLSYAEQAGAELGPVG